MAEAPRRPRARWPWADVPAEIAPLLRPRLPPVGDDIVAAVIAEVPEYARPLTGDFGRLIREGVRVALDQFADLLGHDDELPDLKLYRVLGRGELREGRTLDALQSAYRIGARVAWRHVAEGGQAEGLPPPVLYRLAEAIFAYIDQLSAASVEGYAQEQATRAGSAQLRRQTLVELIARWPPADPADIDKAAGAADWPLPQTVAAVVAGAADPVALARRLPVGTVGGELEVGAVLLVPDPDGPGRARQTVNALGDRPAVVGPTVPWAQAHQSLARARAAWPLLAAGALGDEPVVRADDHLVALLLAADPALARDLVTRHLAPLAALPSGVRARLEPTLRAWLDAHGDVSVAAESLGVHAQTVRYRLAQLHEAFGTALDDPVQRLAIALALRVARGA
ncbi:MAG TPA: helix-turn-helix domain-containing protein [Mycobacteriales bacterium]|nr:helix-turn-helix domain-containing protein [Mycobacteriales bacterium]